MPNAPADERSGLSFVVVTWTASVQFSKSAAGPRQLHILTWLHVPQWQGGPVIYSQAQGSLFVAYYSSQGYGGGILTRLHTGIDSGQEAEMFSSVRHRNQLQDPYKPSVRVVPRHPFAAVLIHNQA
jgi:hypothetical protein